MSRTVRFAVKWDSGEKHPITFGLGDYKMVLSDGGPVGPHGLVDEAADLIEFGAAVAWMERQLPRRRQAPIEISLTFPVRRPSSWSDATIAAASDMLSFVGDVHWNIDVVQRSSRYCRIPDHNTATRSIDQVVLFSGGLDSTSAIAMHSRSDTGLVSFYTRQKTKQSHIATDLDHNPPVQWRWERASRPRPGRSFRYRGAFFLCMAAATASTWDCRRILQCDNGILATAIPPAPAWLMTKHAHPRLHHSAAKFFSALFGAPWDVSNPFRALTKRQCVDRARRANPLLTPDVLAQTDSCWHLSTNLLPGANRQTYPGAKRPGKHCGACISCLVRRTALQDGDYELDMRTRKWQNDQRFGRDFRAYYSFLEQVRAASLDDFYFVLPAPGRRLYGGDLYAPTDLYDMFRTFADEFWEVFVA